MLRAPTLLPLLLILLMPAAASAEIYKWVDANGKVHFGDRPVGADSKSVDIKTQTGATATSTPPAAKERADKARRLLRSFDAKRKQKATRKRQQEAAQALKKKQCQRAQKQLRQLQDNQIIYEERDDGSREYLSDGQRKAYESKIRQRIKENC